jgi:hypothetical protein
VPELAQPAGRGERSSNPRLRFRQHGPRLEGHPPASR